MLFCFQVFVSCYLMLLISSLILWYLNTLLWDLFYYPSYNLSWYMLCGTWEECVICCCRCYSMVLLNYFIFLLIVCSINSFVKGIEFSNYNYKLLNFLLPVISVFHIFCKSVFGAYRFKTAMYFQWINTFIMSKVYFTWH